MKKLLLILLATVVACASDHNDPAPVTGLTNGNNDSTGMDPPGTGSADGVGSADGADVTGGLQCTDDWSVYQCRGVVIPFYYYMNGGTGSVIHFEGIDPGGGAPAQDPYFCSDNIFITAPTVMPDTQELFDACKAKCEQEVDDHVFPAEIGAYKFSGAVECVFEKNGHGGIPHAVPVASGDVADCDWIDTIAPISNAQQVLWDRPATPDDCESLDCSTWDPNTFVSWSYNTSTRTHTTVMPSWFLDEMNAEQGGRMYACDQSRFVHSSTKSTMQTISGDVLYRMGFRTGDYAMQVRRAGSTSYPWYPLTGYVAIATAWTALRSFSSFVVKFRRPTGIGSGYLEHTMNLTLPAI